MSHPKSVRRRFLQMLYQHYMADPLETVPPEVFLDAGIERADLMPNVYYLADRGLIELMRGYNPFLFAGIRITPRGMDMVENRYVFDLTFPPELSEAEGSTAAIPLLIERLVEEAELSPLDGEMRKSLMRDILYLREEVARPVARWRHDVLGAVLGWLEQYLDGQKDECFLPTLNLLKETIERTMAD